MLTTLKALAEETRIRILVILDHGEFSVMEIMQILRMGQSRISRHLKILQSAGIAGNRRDGACVFYHLTHADLSRDVFNKEILKWARSTAWYSALIAEASRVLAERHRRSADSFNRIAPNWTCLRDRYVDFDRFEASILKSFARSHLIADLGCGAGDITTRLVVGGHDVIGVDSSSEMLGKAREILTDALNTHRVDLRLGAIEHLPIRDNEVEGILCSMVLHHLAEPGKAFLEFNRILGRRGVLILIDFLQHDNEQLRNEMGDLWLGFTSVDMTRWLDQSGFKVKRIETIPARHDSIQLLMAIAHKQTSIMEKSND